MVSLRWQSPKTSRTHAKNNFLFAKLSISTCHNNFRADTAKLRHSNNSIMENCFASSHYTWMGVISSMEIIIKCNFQIHQEEFFRGIE